MKALMSPSFATLSAIAGNARGVCVSSAHGHWLGPGLDSVSCKVVWCVWEVTSVSLPSLPLHPLLHPHFSRCSAPRSTHPHHHKQLRKAESQPPQTCPTRICILTRSPGDSCAHWSLRPAFVLLPPFYFSLSKNMQKPNL